MIIWFKSNFKNYTSSILEIVKTTMVVSLSIEEFRKSFNDVISFDNNARLLEYYKNDK